jgi:hypothetical protein
MTTSNRNIHADFFVYLLLCHTIARIDPNERMVRPPQLPAFSRDCSIGEPEEKVSK